MIRSRVTLATIEAAAIDRLEASPLTIVRTAQGRVGAMLPSTSATSGRLPVRASSAAAARRIASRLARRMLIRSISATLAAPTPIPTTPLRTPAHRPA